MDPATGFCLRSSAIMPTISRWYVRAKVSARAAAIEAGLLVVDFPRYGGACNIGAAAALTERAQGRLLCELFNVVSENAQCALIARALEPQLGSGLAQRWRSERSNS